MQSDLSNLATKLTKAQREALRKVCRTNGGGVRIACKVDENGVVVPSARPWRALFDNGLIQGKSGAYERVVHTRQGLALKAHLEQETEHDL